MTSKLNILPPNEEGEGRFPSWLHRRLPRGGELFKTDSILQKHRMNTVCEEAKCPNRWECYAQKTATFLALGKECTRNCGFCSIDFSKTPKAPEADEPQRIALSAKELGLKHIVITMVARDDLADGGATALSAIIHEVRAVNPTCSIEVLTSDFAGNFAALDTVLEANVDIFNHNIETVKSLSTRVRHKASYERTLAILCYAKKSGKARFVKSGIMVGLGEKDDEVHETLRDLHKAGCDIVTIGHYLQPEQRKLTVKAFITPERFKAYEEYGKSLGLPYVYSGPFVRSSYNASQVYDALTMSS